MKFGGNMQKNYSVILDWLGESKETGCTGEIESRYFGPDRVERFGYSLADVLCDIAGRQQMVTGVIQTGSNAAELQCWK